MRNDLSLDTTKRRRAGGIWFGVFMIDVVLTLADGDASTEMLSSHSERVCGSRRVGSE